MREDREGWVCYKVHEPRRIVILKLPDDSLLFFFSLSTAEKSPTPQGKLGSTGSKASTSLQSIFH